MGAFSFAGFNIIIIIVMYMEHMDINNFNTWTKKHIVDENRFDKDDFIIMENDFNYKSTGFKKFNYFNYDALSKRLMKILLDKMEKHFCKGLS